MITTKEHDEDDRMITTEELAQRLSKAGFVFVETKEYEVDGETIPEISHDVWCNSAEDCCVAIYDESMYVDNPHTVFAYGKDDARVPVLVTKAVKAAAVLGLLPQQDGVVVPKEIAKEYLAAKKDWDMWTLAPLDVAKRYYAAVSALVAALSPTNTEEAK